MNLFMGFSNNPDYEQRLKEDIEEYKKQRKLFKSNDLKFILCLDREYLSSDDCLNEILYRYYFWLIDLKLKPSDIVLAFEMFKSKKTFTEKELKNMEMLDSCFRTVGTKIGVKNYDDFYSYSQVLNADSQIKRIANDIKKQKFSPLEKLLYAYIKASSLKKYKAEAEETEKTGQSRTVYGVLNSDKIVCLGYAELLSAIIAECGDENLRSFQNSIGIDYNDGDIDFHANNIVYLKDEKYKIDGFYYLDPTWEKNYKSNVKNLSHFMIEISQIKNITWGTLQDRDDAVRKYYFLKSKKGNNKRKFKYELKTKDKNYSNFEECSVFGVSSKKANFLSINYDDENELNEASKVLLNYYLQTREDFIDFITLEQTKRDCKHSEKDFDNFLMKNYLIAKKNVSELPVYKSKKTLWKYFAEHSPHIDIGQIQNALESMLKKLNPDKDKDKISKRVYYILSKSIDCAQEKFKKEAKTAFSEAEKTF